MKHLSEGLKIFIVFLDPKEGGGVGVYVCVKCYGEGVLAESFSPFFFLEVPLCAVSRLDTHTQLRVHKSVVHTCLSPTVVGRDEPQAASAASLTLLPCPLNLLSF